VREIDRLHQVMIDPRGARTLAIFILRIPGNRDDQRLSKMRFFPLRLRDFEAINPR
jgi:hypothetical protein